MLKLIFFALCAVILSTGSSFARILNPSSFDAVISSTPVIAVAQVEEGETLNAPYFGWGEKFVLSLKENIKGDATGKVSFNAGVVFARYGVELDKSVCS